MRIPLLLSLYVVLLIAVNTNTAYAFNASEKSNILDNTDDFITKWTDITSDVSFYAVTDGPVDYTWSASPSGNSGTGTFDQATPDILVTLSGLNVPAGDVLTLCLEPDNLKRFYNGYLNTGAVATVNPNRLQLLEVTQWGTTIWSSLQYAFFNCNNFNCTATDTPNLSEVTNMEYVFGAAYNFNQDINDWDVSNVTDLSGAFSSAISFNQPLNDWDVSSVTEMDCMFATAFVFNMPISNWNTENVVTMYKMFEVARDFNQSLDSWNVSQVTNMEFMFRSAFDFNQPLNSWDVSKVTTMKEMFQDAISFNQPLNNWDVSMVESMTRMFSSAESFNQALSNWEVNNVTDMSLMFSSATAFNQSINNWNVSNVTFMIGMFAGSSSFNQSLSDLTFHPDVNLSGFLNFSGLDCYHYSTSIHGWASNSLMPDNIEIDALPMEYGTEVIEERDFLINDKNWVFFGDSNSGTICNLALPVSFSHLDIQPDKHTHKIVFSTVAEVNNEKFIIEHSQEAKDFKEIGSIKGAGQSNQIENYSFVNRSPTDGINYYRIKQVDYDGRYEYSDVVSAYHSKEGISVYPNPAHNVIYIESEIDNSYNIYNSLGEKLLFGEISSGANEIDISSLSPGIFWIKTKKEKLTKIIKSTN